MEELPQQPGNTKKRLLLLLKIAVTIFCLWYVSQKIDFSVAGEALSNVNWFYIVLALIAFILSKLVSAHRLNLYFRDIGLKLPPKKNLELYWLGMFYNLFLPGAIGGDAYKVIVLSKQFGLPYKKTTAAVLVDRFSGLLGLVLILAVYSLLLFSGAWAYALIIGGAIAATLLLFLVTRYYLPDFQKSFLVTLLLGIVVQGLQVVCAYLIMAALNITSHSVAYIFLFLVSSAVAVLPLTIGGLGARELVFLEGARYFGLMEENSVIISILFYLITLVTSAWGMIYMFKNPLRVRRAKVRSAKVRDSE
jgi:uncharacterized membrane protein YbhN (UPF0104 family)